jgi:hypothetical protein
VYLGSIRSGALAALAMTAALGGCANVDFSAGGGWFQKPLDVFGRNGGYTYADLGEARKQRTITPNELVDVNGGCPPLAAPQPAPAAAPGSPGMAPAPAPAPDSLLGGGVALGMSECDVVYRAGQPSSVALGKNPNGDRNAVLTYNSGPRPGIYRFERGALMAMDRVAESPAQPQAAKKKPTKAKQASKE